MVTPSRLGVLRDPRDDESATGDEVVRPLVRHSGIPANLPVLLGQFADLVPPAGSSMQDSIREYVDALDGSHADILGLFVFQASGLPELITELIRVRPKQPLPVSMIIDTGLGGVPKAISIAESRPELLSLRIVEMPAPADVDTFWLDRVMEFIPDDVVSVVEARRGPGLLEAVRRVAEYGSRLKFRCGSLSDASYPGVDDVADFLTAISAAQASFKATGMNRAIRHIDPTTGEAHHGYLNLLVATARTLSGHDVREALNSTDGHALAREAATLSEQSQRTVRGVFASCSWTSFAEGVQDLTRLGLRAQPGPGHGAEFADGSAGA